MTELRIARRCGLLALFAIVVIVATTPASADTIRVEIGKLVFSPVNVTAKAGDTIEWVNRDAFAHTATVKGEWDVMIPPGQTATVTLIKAGSLEYFCRFHPNMKGRIDISAR